ncbi:DUF4132 domain-containing protein [Bradyrhizobium sp. HKCCYLR20261]|uniref:DUF4132 domain-containing protein n=1 Tax=Bradyrhizobium sp. HKCCYLR20261 TaxID=3420760 RepID=UPI003EC0B9CC
MAEALDGERVPFVFDYQRAGRIADLLSEADRLRLLGRLSEVAAAVGFIELTWPDAIEQSKVRAWLHLLGSAFYSLERKPPRLDDQTAAILARAARISAPFPTHKSSHPFNLAGVLLAGLPDPMSAAQRAALEDVADLIDRFAWGSRDYANAIRALEPVYHRLGRPFSDSALHARRERAKQRAQLAVAHICQDVRPPLKEWIEALCQLPRDDATLTMRNAFPAQILASSPAERAETLCMMVEANRRQEALKTGRIAGFPVFGEYTNYASIGSVTESGSHPFADLLRALVKTKLVASDAAAAAMLNAMPTIKVLVDLRIINTAIATIKAGSAPLTTKAALACLAWLEKRDTCWSLAKDKSFNDQAVHRLKTALDRVGRDDAAVAPLLSRPVLKGWANSVVFEQELITYYSDISDLRKCTHEDVAFVEHYLQGPKQPEKPFRATEGMTQEEFDEGWAISRWHRYSRLFPPPLLERMRKVAQIPAEYLAAWQALHACAYELEGKSAPSAKWLKAARESVAHLSEEQRLALLIEILDVLTPAQGYPTDNLARAVIYVSADWAADSVGPLLTRHALTQCFDTIPNWGMRNERLGNACLWALIHMPSGGGVRYLARLLSRIKYPKVKKRIEAALNEAAAAAGMTRRELDELSVPTHGLDAQGSAEIAVGDGAALLAISGTASVEVTWRGANGKISKSIPAALKPHKDEIKAVKALVKEIEADLSIQPQRLQRLWLDDARWTAEIWQQRYAEHPLLGALSRRLIWNVHRGDQRVAALWSGGRMIDVDGAPVAIDGAEITLWHPVGCPVAEVMAWRARLGALDLTQPFKQAHREVYLVTDAERRTATYSNRFAGHIVKQHQLMALARLNGWMVTHRIWADTPNDQPTHIVLPRHGLVAEFWTAGAGGDDPEVSDGQAYLYLTTDQLRFYRVAAPAGEAVMSARGPERGAAVDIADVPPLVLSEVMRHCDLFVSVASVANDPTWADGGGAAEHPSQWRRTAGAAYWQRQAFGDLGAMAEMRRALLETLLPSLAVGKVSRIIDGKYLHVQGRLNAYKIHVGSANILIEPTDHYLCIVPASAGASDLRLPFEGDSMLSVILSKAVMLAADDEISDPTILSQLRVATGA